MGIAEDRPCQAHHVKRTRLPLHRAMSKRQALIPPAGERAAAGDSLVAPVQGMNVPSA